MLKLYIVLPIDDDFMPMDEILDHLPPKLADFVFTQGSLTARLEAHLKKPKG